MSEETSKHIVFFKHIDKTVFSIENTLYSRNIKFVIVRGESLTSLFFFFSPGSCQFPHKNILIQGELLRFGKVSYFHTKCELIVLCVNVIYNRVEIGSLKLLFQSNIL